MKKEALSFGNYVSNVSFLKKNNLITKKDRILEIGSGEGKLLNTLLNKDYQVEGVELSSKYVEKSKEIFGDNLPVRKVKNYKLPYSNSTFDKVISFDVLEHIPDTDMHLKEVSRVLKSGGKYCFGIPNRLTDEPFCIWVYKSFTKYKQPGRHCSLQTFWAIKRKLKTHGFHVTTYNQKQYTKWLKNKLYIHFGSNGLKLFDFLKINNWPIWLKPTLYIVGTKV